MLLSDREKAATQSNSSAIVAGAAVPKRRSRYNLPLIIRREYLTRVQQRSFQVVTILLMLIVIIGVSFPTIFAAITAQTQTQMVVINSASKIGTLNDQALLAFLHANLNTGYDNTQGSSAPKPTQKAHFALRLGSVGELDALRQQVRNNKLSILLQIARTSSGELVFTYYTDEMTTQNTDLSLVQAVAAQLQVQDKLGRLGIGQAQAASLFSPPTFQVSSALQEQSGRSTVESNEVIILTICALALLFIFIQQYCNSVATGVAEEKGSRIMEILINATTPFQLLLGKIIGVGLVGATQMSLVCLVGGAALLAQGPLSSALNIETASRFTSFDITAPSLGILGLLVLYFIFGFLLYATLYAAAGALVSRQEEVVSSTGPLSVFIMASYLISFYATITPRASWIVPLSYVPFFTPMMMLAREAITPLPWWEIVLSSVLMLASIFALTWLAAYIYRVGVLMYGQKPGFGAFFRYLRTAKTL